MAGLKEWFKQDWVDIGSPKKGGGYAKCGRTKQKKDAKRKYPKCVPRAKANAMTKSQIKSAVKRKRAKPQGVGGKPTNVKTIVRRKKKKKATKKKGSIPTNKALYNRVKAEAKRKFDVYTSAYANAWLVRTYKKRGGGYRSA